MEILAVVLAVAGLGVGYGGNMYVEKRKNAANEDRAAKELAKAKKEADRLLQSAREDAARIALRTQQIVAFACGQQCPDLQFRPRALQRSCLLVGVRRLRIVTLAPQCFSQPEVS